MASLRAGMSLLVLTVIFLICLMSMMGCGSLHESNLVILLIMVKMNERMASLRAGMSLLVLTVIFLICLMSMMGCGSLRESNQGHLVILLIMVKMFFISYLILRL
jgi:hypothetical protein